MNATWIFKNGTSKIECTSFPYAFRLMWTAIRRGTETQGQPNGKTPKDVAASMSIISPVKDALGRNKIYGYTEARELAVSQGLLNNEGQINNREFKHR